MLDLGERSWTRSALRVKRLLVLSLCVFLLFSSLLFVRVAWRCVIVSNSLSQLNYIVLWGGCEYVVSLSIEVVHYLTVNPRLLDVNRPIEFQTVHEVLVHIPFVVELRLELEIVLRRVRLVSPSNSPLSINLLLQLLSYPVVPKQRSVTEGIVLHISFYLPWLWNH